MSGGTLVVITGPTGVGKTAAAVVAALTLGTEVISADSRQIFRGIPIGTGAPTAAELSAVRHHLVGVKCLDEYYSAAMFEADALALLPGLFARSGYAVMCGGSMMYVDAVCRGIDSMPTISAEVRDKVARLYRDCGAECVLAQLELLDPEYVRVADTRNTKRLLHALEVCYQSGRAYSTFCTGARHRRPFRIVKVGLNRPRAELFARIGSRVDAMVSAGLEEEARRVYHLRHLNSLNTVGFKEMFSYFDGVMDFASAVERIKKNTRVYAKKQLTWLAKDDEIVWMRPEEVTPRRVLELVSDARPGA